MGYKDKKFNNEYIDNVWNERILPNLSDIEKSGKKYFILHLCLHIILFVLMLFLFRKYTLPAMSVENDPFFYILAIIPNIVLGYYSRVVFVDYKNKIKNLYNCVLEDFDINTHKENHSINLRDIKLNFPNMFNTAYIEDIFFGKYDDIPYELAVVKMEKLSCTVKNKFYNKITGSILVINDFLDLKYSAVISKNLDINAKNSEDEEKVKEFINSDYFANFNNIMNLNGILFKGGKIFIFLRHPNSFGFPKDIKKVTMHYFKEFFNMLFKDIMIIDELQISQKYENVTRDFVYSEDKKQNMFMKYFRIFLIYLIFLMITFYMVTILSITIMLSFIHQYWSWVLYIISPVISIILAFFLTKSYAKQIFNK